MTLKITAKNSAYWQNRDKYEREYILKNLADDEQLNRRLQLYYDQAIDNINQIIDSELAKTINIRTGKPSKMDVEAYQRTAKKIVQEAKLRRSQGQSVSYSDYSKAVNDHLRIYNATMRINRLEMIKSQIGLEMTRAGLNVDADLRYNLATKYQDEINRQAGIMGESVPSSLLTSSAIAKTIMAQTNSATFSDRIWANQDALKAKLDVALTNGIIQGQNPRKIARNLKGVVSDAVKNHRYVTERIARTETARVQHKAQLESMKSTGVKYVKWMTEPKACDECQGIQMAKPTEYGSGIYELDKVPSIPVHPNCRCAIGAWYPENEKVSNDRKYGHTDFTVASNKQSEFLNKITPDKIQSAVDYIVNTEFDNSKLSKFSTKQITAALNKAHEIGFDKKPLIVKNDKGLVLDKSKIYRYTDRKRQLINGELEYSSEGKSFHGRGIYFGNAESNITGYNRDESHELVTATLRDDTILVDNEKVSEIVINSGIDIRKAGIGALVDNARQDVLSMVAMDVGIDGFINLDLGYVVLFNRGKLVILDD